MRKLFIAGNWKMNKCLAEAVALAKGVADRASSLQDAEVAVCPTFVHLAAVCDAVAGTNVAVGGQNLYVKPDGAFTGEISAPMLADVGCKYVLAGHSERRHVFGEPDDLVAQKVRAALDGGLDVILCVGEQLAERQAGQMKDVVRRHVQTGLGKVAAEEMARLVIAYEPVWAIGTDINATPQQAQEVHEYIRALLAKAHGDRVAQATRIQYGGSVKPANARDILSQPDVDGALVGGASLDVDSFIGIIQAGLAAKCS